MNSMFVFLLPQISRITVVVVAVSKLTLQTMPDQPLAIINFLVPKERTNKLPSSPFIS